MSAVTFDALKFAETLESVKMPREQATAIAAGVRDAHINAEMATKAYVADLRKDTDNKFELLRKDIEAVAQRLDAKIEAESNKLIIRLSGVLLAFIGAAVAVLRYWPAP